MSDTVKAWIEERRAIHRNRHVNRNAWAEATRDWAKEFPRALDALNAVLELHVKGYETAGAHWCSECEMTWPCVTVQAIEGAINHE